MLSHKITAQYVLNRLEPLIRFPAAVLLIVFILHAAAVGQGTDNPPTPQAPHTHSSIVVSDGMGGTTSVRDDVLAGMIKSAIDQSGNLPSSVKVFFNSCYGGGMLDDISDMLGTFSPTIPFIGGSASTAEQPALGDFNATAENGLGSTWTNALAEAINNSGSTENVVDTVAEAAANDNAATGGSETPQTTSAHGGANVMWSSRAQSVVFSGNNTAPRHDNNVTNMEVALLNKFEQPESNVFSSGSGIDPTQAALQSLLDQAADALASDGSEELVLYVDDHGSTSFDYQSFWEASGSQPLQFDSDDGWDSKIDPEEGGSGEQSELHDGWHEGLSGNEAQGDTTNPGLNILPDIIAPFDFDLFFDAFFNGVPLNLPAVLIPGQQAFIPVPWDAIHDGPNLLEFLPDQPGAGPSLPILGLELTSGPINDLLFGSIPEPAACVMAAIGFVMLFSRRSRVC